MARLDRITTSDGVQLVTRTGPDGRERIESFHAVLYRKLREATLTQIRVIAEESREIILDKLFAAPPARGMQARAVRPRRLRRQEIRGVDRRPYRHTALAKRTVEKKKASREDGRKLIATAAYAYGIEVFKGTRGGEPYYTVRPKPGKHPERGVTHRVLAGMHEFGTTKMPKRPHWGPALRMVRQVLQAQGPEVRAKALREAIRERA